jgi:phosphatidylinositol alpha-mannosyltransferase
MVLLEAMSSGVPIVASKISGFQLVMEHERQGLLIPSATDADGFAAALTRLLDSPEDRARMGEAGRQTAVCKYSWSEVARRLEECYTEAICERKVGR